MSVIVAGCLVLTGWALGVTPLQDAASGSLATKPTTSLCFVLMGVALLALRPVATSRQGRVLGYSAAGGACFIALLTVSQHALGFDLGIHRGLLVDAPPAPGASGVSMMTGTSAFGFTLLAGALACMKPGCHWRAWLGPTLALGAAVLAGVTLISYLSGTSPYVGDNLTQMPIPTALGFFLLASGIFCARPSYGPMRLLTSDTAGGTVVRVLFPAAIALPLLLGALRSVSDLTGAFQTDAGIWFLVLSSIALLVPLSWTVGGSLDRAERERRRAQVLSHDAQRERAAFENAPIGAIIGSCEGNIERVNRSFCQMTGYAPEELIGMHFLDLTHPEDRHLSADAKDEAISGGGSQHYEKRYLHRNGSTIHASVSLTAIEDEGGAVVQLFAQIEDVTLARRAADELEDAQLEMLARLAAAAEFHDDDTSQHTRRVGELSADIAKRLGLPTDQVDLILLAAPLHDIGKLAIPDAVLGKRGKLTFEEFEEMKTHTTIGARMLAGSAYALLGMAERIALTHHERWDGSGYPAGLAGMSIPISGRIVAVADVFDALTHSRPYKAAWTPEAAIEEMVSQSGRHFDPEVLDAFLSLKRIAAKSLTY